MIKYNFVTEIEKLEKEIDSVWGYADFGIGTIKTNVVKFALLKSASGYSNGHTAQCILIALGLITEKLNITKKGKYWLWEFFQKGYK